MKAWPVNFQTNLTDDVMQTSGLAQEPGQFLGQTRDFKDFSAMFGGGTGFAKCSLYTGTSGA